MALNLSLILRADAASFTGEVRQAGSELKGLGSEARGAGGVIGGALSQGVSAAQSALGPNSWCRG